MGLSTVFHACQLSSFFFFLLGDAYDKCWEEKGSCSHFPLPQFHIFLLLPFLPMLISNLVIFSVQKYLCNLDYAGLHNYPHWMGIAPLNAGAVPPSKFPEPLTLLNPVFINFGKIEPW